MRFKRVYVEISNLCNLQCAFCSPLKRPKGMMTTEQFRAAAEQLRPYTHYLYLHLKGEPLVHPGLEEILGICGKLGFEVNITTNGTLLKEKEEILFRQKAVRQVNLSVHSFSQIPAAEARQCLLDAVAFGKRAVQQGRPFVIYRMWNLGKGKVIDPESLEILEQIGAEFPTAHNLAAELQENKSAAVAKGIFLSWEEEFTWPSLDAPSVPDSGKCYGTRQMLGVLCDGTVVPCCLDGNGEEPLGNLFQTPFSEIVESEGLQKAASGFDGGKAVLELCKHCTYRLKFKPGKGNNNGSKEI